MCLGNTLAENQQHLKKSIARMMVYWVAHTRENLLEEILGYKEGDAIPSTWADLGFQDVFDSAQEYKDFLLETTKLFNRGFDTNGTAKIKAVRVGAERINARVWGTDGLGVAGWCPEIFGECPPNNFIKVMFNAAMGFVDNTDLQLIVAARKLEQVEQGALKAPKPWSASKQKPAKKK